MVMLSSTVIRSHIAVQRLARLDIAAVRVAVAVAFGVHQVGFDVVVTVGAAVAAQHDVARMQQLAVGGLTEWHRRLLLGLVLRRSI